MVDEPGRIPKYGAENRVGINGTITIRELYKGFEINNFAFRGSLGRGASDVSMAFMCLDCGYTDTLRLILEDDRVFYRRGRPRIRLDKDPFEVKEK